MIKMKILFQQLRERLVFTLYDKDEDLVSTTPGDEGGLGRHCPRHDSRLLACYAGDLSSMLCSQNASLVATSKRRLVSRLSNCMDSATPRS